MIHFGGRKKKTTFCVRIFDISPCFFIQIPCHHVLANEIALNLKYRIGLKHVFNINLGIGIIKKTTFFVRIFDISPCVLTQISIGRARWMWN